MHDHPRLRVLHPKLVARQGCDARQQRIRCLAARVLQSGLSAIDNTIVEPCIEVALAFDSSAVPDAELVYLRLIAYLRFVIRLDHRTLARTTSEKARKKEENETVLFHGSGFTW